MMDSAWFPLLVNVIIVALVIVLPILWWNKDE